MVIIMFLLLLLLAALLIYEERNHFKEEEGFATVIDDMIVQLQLNEAEIMKNKTGSLVLLSTMKNLIITMQDSYEAKLLRWECELKKLKDLNEKVENQINHCKEEETKEDLYEKCLEIISQEKNQSTKSKNNIGKNEDKIINDNVQKQEVNKTQMDYFDLEKEILSSPVLKKIYMEPDRQDEMPWRNKNSQRTYDPCSSSSKAIYEPFCEENGDITTMGLNKLMLLSQQLLSNFTNPQSLLKPTEQLGESELMKFIQKHCGPASIYNAINVAKPSSPISPINRTGQQKCPQNLSNIIGDKFFQNKDDKNIRVDSNQGSSSIHNLLWYSGPFIQNAADTDSKSCPRLFEYKLKHQTREPYCQDRTDNAFVNWPAKSNCQRVQETNYPTVADIPRNAKYEVDFDTYSKYNQFLKHF